MWRNAAALFQVQYPQFCLLMSLLLLPPPPPPPPLLLLLQQQLERSHPDASIIYEPIYGSNTRRAPVSCPSTRFKLAGVERDTNGRGGEKNSKNGIMEMCEAKNWLYLSPYIGHL
jgi:hypothetical protein